MLVITTLLPIFGWAGGFAGGGTSEIDRKFTDAARTIITKYIAADVQNLKYAYYLNEDIDQLDHIYVVDQLKSCDGQVINYAFFKAYSCPGFIQLLKPIWEKWVDEPEFATNHGIEIIHEVFRAARPELIKESGLDFDDEANKITEGKLKLGTLLGAPEALKRKIGPCGLEKYRDYTGRWTVYATEFIWKAKLYPINGPQEFQWQPDTIDYGSYPDRSSAEKMLRTIKAKNLCY